MDLPARRRAAGSCSAWENLESDDVRTRRLIDSDMACARWWCADSCRLVPSIQVIHGWAEGRGQGHGPANSRKEEAWPRIP